MKQLQFFVVTSIVMVTLSCRSRNFQPTAKIMASPSPSGKTITSGLPALLFSWSTSARAGDAPKYIRDALAGAQKCLKEARLTSEKASCLEGAAGPGFYVAFDPFASRNYGDTLVMLPLPAKTSVHVVQPNDGWESQENVHMRVILSDVGIIAYPFTGATLHSIGISTAMVVRGSSGLDLSAARSIKLLKSGKPLAKHESFTCTDATPVEEILKNWGDHMELLHAAAGQPPELVNSPQAKEFANGLIFVEGKVTKNGVLVAAVSDAVAGGRLTQAIVTKTLTAIPDARSAVMKCLDRSSPSTTEKDCLMASIGMNTYRNGAGAFLTNQDKLNILRSLGVEGFLPDDWDVALEGLVKIFDSASLARLKEVNECGLAMRRQLSAAKLSEWL